MSNDINRVWVVLYTEDGEGPESILEIFQNKKDAKQYIAKYVLSNAVRTEFLKLIVREVK